MSSHQVFQNHAQVFSAGRSCTFFEASVQHFGLSRVLAEVPRWDSVSKLGEVGDALQEAAQDDGREELALAAIKRRKRAELAPSEGGATDWATRTARPAGPASIKHLLPPDLGWANIQDVESAVLARVSGKACMIARCTLAKHLFLMLLCASEEFCSVDDHLQTCRWCATRMSISTGFQD